MMQTIWRDVKYGVRMLVKSPGFSLVAILTLALGIGAVTTIFSVVDAVLLQPLPFAEPSRIVAIGGIDTRNNEHDRALSYLDFADLRKENRTMESMAAHSSGDFTLIGAG